MTETQTVDLASWLTAVWDEEERLAKACLGVNVLAGMRRGIDPPRWVREGTAIYDDRPYGGRVLRVNHSWPEEIAHITLHDPASVLARIAADRKILELHKATDWYTPDELCCEICHEDRSQGPHAWQAPGERPCATLKALASPYKGREGWQEAWAHE